MRKLIASAFALGLFAVATVPASAQVDMTENEEVELTATVVDMSCKAVFNLSGDDHRMCAQVCADNDIPLGLLTANGDFYLPVSGGMPGTGANAMLRPHAEHQVVVTGKVFKRGGLNAIIIDDLSMPGDDR